MRTTARMFSSNIFLLINSLALILLFALLLSVEARRHSTDESNISELRHHRHRHRHEALGQRWPGTASRKRPFNDDNDYEENYTSDVDYEEYNYEDEGDQSEEDYATERRNSRLYPPKRNNNIHHRYEPRYPAPRYYHRGAAHHVGTGRGHEARGGGHDRVNHRRTSNSRSGYRKRYKDDGQDSSEEEADGYIDRPATSRRHYEDSSDDDSTSDILANEPDSYYYGKHKSSIPRKRIPAYSSSFSDVGESKGRRSRYEPRKDRRYKVDEEEDEYGYDADDEYEEDEVEDEDNERVNRSRKYAMRKAKVPKAERNRDEPILGRHSSSSGSSKFDEWFKRTRMMINNDSRSHDLAKKRNTRTHYDEDEQQDNEELTADTDDENDEVELWKDDDEDKELDNDFYKNENDSSTTPLKTFDDIIRRLTDDSASTTTGIPTTQIKRDYRNTDHGSYLRPDAYGNLRMYELKRNASLANQSRYRSSTSPVSRNMNYVDFTSTTTGRKDTNKSNSAKKKSLERYEAENNAKGEEDEGTQADANTDYAEDENEEDEGSATSLVTRSTTTTVTPTTPSTTTTTRATTATMTTTQRSYPRYNERKDSRSYHDGAQYNGYQAKNDYPPMSAYSAHKWQTLGTRQGVKETRKNMAQYKSGQSPEGNAAHDHVMHVAKEGSCEWPRPKVIPVHDIYPNLTAIYDPHCAILHRCSDDTGCCRSETMTCVAKHTQRVEFYFYATYISKLITEKLSFDNHTACECREKKEISDRPTDHRTARQMSYLMSSAPQNIVKPLARKPCRCTTQFTPKITVEGVCECSCVQDDHGCLKLRRGKGFISLTDRQCIQRGECTPPNCEYGEYVIAKGNCPKKKDMFEYYRGRPSYPYHPRRS